MLVAVIEAGSTQLDIYYMLYFSATSGSSILFFKKYLYILLHTINLQNLPYFKIKSEQKLQFISLREFFSEKGDNGQPFNKLTIVELGMRLEPNRHKRYGVNDKPPKIFSKNNKHYTYVEIKLTANLVLLQHYAREPTVISEKFIEAIQQLGTTQYFLDTQIIEQFENLIIQQLGLL